MELKKTRACRHLPLHLQWHPFHVVMAYVAAKSQCHHAPSTVHLLLQVQRIPTRHSFSLISSLHAPGTRPSNSVLGSEEMLQVSGTRRNTTWSSSWIGKIQITKKLPTLASMISARKVCLCGLMAAVSKHLRLHGTEVSLITTWTFKTVPDSLWWTVTWTWTTLSAAQCPLSCAHFALEDGNPW